MKLLALLAVTLFIEPSSSELVEGFAEPYRKIELAPAEPGVLAELRVKEGDTVTEGQIVASLDRDVLTITRDIATANTNALARRDAAEAERSLRLMRLTRLSDLRERGHASQEELDRARTELKIAEAHLREVHEQYVIDELEVKKVDAMIERRLVRSPINGVVTRVHREEKEFVTANSPMVVSVAQLNPLRVTLNLPARRVATLKAQTITQISVPEMDRLVTARVELISPIIDAESGTVRVKFLVDNSDGSLKSGMRCTLPLETPPLASSR